MNPTNHKTGGGVDVVVIDDEDSIREGCRQALESNGYRAAVVSDGVAGLKLLESTHPRVVLLDLRMPGISGIEVLERLPGIDPRIIPIVITGYGSVETAVSSMKLGAVDFITKPFDPDQLMGAVERGLSRWAAFAPVPVVKSAPRKEEPVPARAEADVVLSGLDALGQFYELREGSSTLAAELKALEQEAEYYSKRLGRVQEKEKVIQELATDLRLVDSIIARHQFKRSALIQILLDVQAAKNWLPRHTLTWIARRLGVPMARILEVATFYEAFSLVPQGRHTVQVCMGTACHVRHSPELLAMVSSLLGLKPGETDPELRYTLKQVHCVGCCALAPVVKVDDTYYGHPSLQQLKEIFTTNDEPAKAKGAH